MSIRLSSTLFAASINFKNSKSIYTDRSRSCRFSVRSCVSDSPNANKLVLEVKERLAKDCTSLPIGKNGRDDEEMILWFLKDRRFSVDEAIGKLTKAIKWRHEFKVNELSEDSVKAAAETGKAYVHGFLDVKGRPVVIVAPAKHIPGLLDPIEDEKLCVFLLEKALSKLPAGQHKILGIFDLRGFGSQNADLKFLTFLFDVFYYYYPSRLDEVLFVDAPFIFQPIWQFTKPVVKSYASLVKFCSVETVRKEYFTEETIPSNFRS
ncbi:PREDICTED: motile sperm domain-containing protein 2 [Brassica oleracea var. oleracea]|uniref:CRAL-TRIO domain-containing protein n=1 Tax=Brassica oleracea var. oleracea TaxID=109376 RepID=A0A0D3E1Y8_BRAOL|nr:PREDICTED: motile sperm domain-containing protein 2 [Brassica oleracea var. oleracea]